MVFLTYFKSVYKIFKNELILNLQKRDKLFFKKISLLNDLLTLYKKNYDPDFTDLRFLYELIVNKKISTILEFGTGYSTVVMSAALKANSTKNNKIFVLETEKKWINYTKKKLKYKNCKIIHSKSIVKLLGMTICHTYKNLPNITPDLIYLDGPDPDSVKGKILNLNYQKSNTPISADILLYEYRLKPGAIIIVDGRLNNVAFLKRHLKRKYKFKFYKLFNRSEFVLLN